jgi:hypothetical protein
MMGELNQPMDNLDADRSAIETEAGRREFLQAALQESFTLDLTSLGDAGTDLIRALSREYDVEIDTKKALEDAYALCLQRGEFAGCKKLEDYSRDNSINAELVLSKELLDENVAWLIMTFRRNFIFLPFTLSDAVDFATAHDIQLTIPQDAMQKRYELEIQKGSIEEADMISKAAKELNMELTVTPEIAQAGAENIAQGNYDFHSINRIADRPLDNTKHLEKFTKWCQQRDVELQNVTVAKIVDYHHLEKEDVSEELQRTVETHVDGHPITVRLYGRRRHGSMEGKFIVGITPERGLELAFDSTHDEHVGISGKYRLRAIGGGFLEINDQKKQVIISGKSLGFGFDPRSITTKALTEAFPGYAIETE